MASKKKKDLENLSIEELQLQIEENKRQIKHSSVMTLSALIALIALCMAWFIFNNVTKGTTSQISADNNIPFYIASVGNRQKAEEDYLKDPNGTSLLSEGSEKEYTSYYDLSKNKVISTSQTYHMGTAGLAWYLSGQESIRPGSSGKLEFYIIPKQEGLSKISINLELEAYQEFLPEGGSKRATKIDNDTVQNLLKGHLLLFQKLTDQDGYSDWISDGKFTVSTKEGQTFQLNTPYKVTVYWIWPKYFRNYIYNARTTYGDLSTESDQKLLEFVKNTNNQNMLFYDTSKINISGTIDENMSDTVLDECNKYYNQADEFIGNSMQYVYIKASLSR